MALGAQKREDARRGKKNGVSGNGRGGWGMRHTSLRINGEVYFSSCPLEPMAQDLGRG